MAIKKLHLPRLGVHLPLYELLPGAGELTCDSIRSFVRCAHGLDFEILAASDHIRFRGPWMDGIVALSASLADSGNMTLMTSAALPVIRGAPQLAKALRSIRALSRSGELIAGVASGSYRGDFEATGMPFNERDRLFVRAVSALRCCLTDDARLSGISDTPIWIGSWGSGLGLKRVAALGDGWLASAYNEPADGFRASKNRLDDLRNESDSATAMPWGVSTTFLYVDMTGGKEARRRLEQVSRRLGRDPDYVGKSVLMGSPAECAERLRTYSDLSAELILLWPVEDWVRQLELFREYVVPAVH